MKKYQVVLFLDALALISFGVAFFVSPHGMTGTFGITLSGTDAVADVCAVYGGLELGLGVFLLWCAWKSQAIKPGLVAGTLCLCGFFLGRLVGIATEGHPSGATYQLLSLDALGAFLNTGFLVHYLRRGA